MELLHRGIEDLLDHAWQAMHLVDEQHRAIGEVREDRGEVRSALDGGAAGHVDRHSKLARDHVRERGLANAGRAVERDVLQRVAARLRRRDDDPQLLLDRVLVDVLVVAEALRTERGLERALLAGQRRGGRLTDLAQRAPISGRSGQPRTIAAT